MPLADSFADRAAAAIARLAADPDRRARLADAARRDGAALNAAHEAAQRELARLIMAGG